MGQEGERRPSLSNWPGAYSSKPLPRLPLSHLQWVKSAQLFDRATSRECEGLAEGREMYPSVVETALELALRTQLPARHGEDPTTGKRGSHGATRVRVEGCHDLRGSCFCKSGWQCFSLPALELDASS